MMSSLKKNFKIYAFQNFESDGLLEKLTLSTTQKMFLVDLVTLTEEIFNGKLHFLCSIAISFTKSYFYELNIYLINVL